ncbi:MAG: hypothetical protein NC930_01455 [Candidatus Omnitrophica bacterium]|nr:hypothetical protein [Candidatus Omnitrophota bacterium]
MKRIADALVILGLVIYIVAVIGRYYGTPFVVGHQASSLLILGTGFFVLACYLKISAK